MQPATRNALAAGFAGALLGAFAMSVLVWHYGNFIGGPRPDDDGGARRLAAVDRFTGGVPTDDVVAVLDAQPHDRPADAARPAPVPIDPSVPALTPSPRGMLDDLRARRLTVPVEGVTSDRLVQTFDDPRGGSRVHEAIDILAPRHTPVVAVEDGTVARLFTSRAGGITVYQYDPSSRFVYYYAHLDRYADGLEEGAAVRRGQVLGYVGTSGNAPPDTPHLHFAIFEMDDAKRWWEGRPIDPFLVLR